MLDHNLRSPVRPDATGAVPRQVKATDGELDCSYFEVFEPRSFRRSERLSTQKSVSKDGCSSLGLTCQITFSIACLLEFFSQNFLRDGLHNKRRKMAD